MSHSQLNDLYRTPSLYVLKWLKPSLAGLSWLICNQLGLARPFLVKPCLAKPSQAKPSHGNTTWMAWSEGLSFLGCALGPGCPRLYQNPRSHCYVEFWALGPLEFRYSAGVGLLLTQPASESLRVTVGERKRS